MSDLGLPNIDVRFREAGISRIGRGKRGRVALILKDDAVMSPMTLENINEIPDELSDFNKDQIKKTMLGYRTPPLSVYIYVQKPETTEYDDALKHLEQSNDWDWLAIPEVEQSDTGDIATWIKQLRDIERIKKKAVLPHTEADHEGVVNFTTEDIRVGDRVYTTAEYCGRIAGLICGTPLKIAPTYAPLPEVDTVKYLNKSEREQAINDGEFIIYHDGKKVKASRGVNSFVTTGQDKIDSFKKIKIVEAMDIIHDDIVREAEDNYIGKYANSYDNKCLLIQAIQAYFEGLELDEIVAPGSTLVELDLAKQENWLKAGGFDTSDLTVKQLKTADTGSHVFLRANTKILDAIEDIQLPITI